ncbi:GcrA family cell cycle regulator [Methylobacterium nodulans]|uniref:GcrA cell cycle regulator n=1 Tax=Methylobacterium nodulans (strain LMG 21967 / CNCM I-2342 / ORS 2060) TaxID=460265 RepID=B8IRS5_METNO|nr:GcrA cell cycle regulator [Methylobacterium nodulans]ACL60625.1 GcrA cell cycle regulator [Methylobacterium nodulans ORS 2060]
MSGTEWPSAAIDMLRELWSAGKSGSAIAEAINAAHGLSLSRSAVMGKIRRLGLVGQQGVQPEADTPAEPAAPEPAAAPAEPPQPYVFRPEGKPAERPADGYLLHQLGPGDCRYPITGSVAPSQHRFCGEPVKDGSCYCLAHFRIAYSPPGAFGVSYASLAEKQEQRDLQAAE